MSDDTGGRISVSEEKLLRMFSDFKLELFAEMQKYATSAALTAATARFEIGQLESQRRLTVLELWRASQEGETDKGRRFSAAALAWSAIAAAVVVGLLTVIASVLAARYHH